MLLTLRRRELVDEAPGEAIMVIVRPIAIRWAAVVGAYRALRHPSLLVRGFTRYGHVERIAFRGPSGTADCSL